MIISDQSSGPPPIDLITSTPPLRSTARPIEALPRPTLRTARLSSLDTSQIARVGTIGEKRAPVILGGLVVLEASLLAMGAIDMTISERDLLHGVAIALVSN